MGLRNGPVALNLIDTISPLRKQHYLNMKKRNCHRYKWKNNPRNEILIGTLPEVKATEGRIAEAVPPGAL